MTETVLITLLLFEVFCRIYGIGDEDEDEE